MNSWRGTKSAWALCLVATVVVLAASCTSPPKGNGTPGPYPGPPPETSIWFAGDSLAYLTATKMPDTPFWKTAVGGAGFTDSERLVKGRIIDIVLAEGVDVHLPDVVLAMGGVNDFSAQMTPQDVIDSMEEFGTTLAGLGVPVRWVLEPAWGYAPLSEDAWAWQLAHPDAIDCRHAAGQSVDGIHPLDAKWLGVCVNSAVHG